MTAITRTPSQITAKRFGHLGGDRPQPGIDAPDLPYQVPREGFAGRLWWCLGADLWGEASQLCWPRTPSVHHLESGLPHRAWSWFGRPDPLSRQIRLRSSRSRANTTVMSSAATTEASPRGAATLAAAAASITSSFASPAPRQLTHPGGRGPSRRRAPPRRGPQATGLGDNPDLGRSLPRSVAPRTDAPNPTAAGNRRCWHLLIPTTPTCSSPRPGP